MAQVRNEAGKWTTAPDGARPERWRARTKYRDSDGVLRDVERFAPTKGRAVAKLKQALADRSAPSKSRDGLRADMSVEDAGDYWLGQVDRPDSDLSERTRHVYRDAFDRYVRGSSITGLTLREANSVAVLERWLQQTADTYGTGAAKTARTVVSSIVTLAVRYGVLPHNAVRDVRPAKASTARAKERDTSRAFSRTERDAVLAVAAEHEQARSADVADLVWFLAGTGVRIGEALGQRWDDVDLDAGTVYVRGTKTERSMRTLNMPEWLVQKLQDRAGARGKVGLVFSSPGKGTDPHKLRDQRNVNRVVRQVLTDAGHPWATSHTFRRTVASLLDEAGLPIALAANQLGHADAAMTARVYLGRKGDTKAAAGVL